MFSIRRHMFPVSVIILLEFEGNHLQSGRCEFRDLQGLNLSRDYLAK